MVIGGTSVGLFPMIHAVLPSAFLLPGIKNVTIIQDNAEDVDLAADSFSYYLYK